MSDKLTSTITLSAQSPTPISEIAADESGHGLICGNIRLRLTSTKPIKLDIWLLRVHANDPTCYNTHTHPGGTEDFYAWPVWFGSIAAGEIYRWLVRLDTGLTGTLTTRYAKGCLIPT
jgi:hypothetical protein